MNFLNTLLPKREEAKGLLQIEETVRRVEPIFRHPDQNLEELKALFADLQRAANIQYRLMFETLARQAFFTDAEHGHGSKRLALNLPPKSSIQDLRIDIGLKRGVLAVEAKTLPLLVVKENPRDYNQDYFQPQRLYLSAIDDDKSFIWAEFGIDLSGEVNYVNITEGKARVIELEGGKSVAAGFLPEPRNECMISFINPYFLARLATITANFGPMSI